MSRSISGVALQITDLLRQYSEDRLRIAEEFSDDVYKEAYYRGESDAFEHAIWLIADILVDKDGGKIDK